LASRPEFDPNALAAPQRLPPSGFCGPPVEFVALRRLQKQAATCTGFASPGYAASSDFLGLLTLHSACNLASSVSRRQRPWAFAFRGFPLPVAAHRLRFAALPAVSPAARACPPIRFAPEGGSLDPPVAAPRVRASERSVLIRSGVIRSLPADPLLAFSSSRSSPISLGHVLPRDLPSWASSPPWKANPP
jgi:hypothetical protein